MGIMPSTTRFLREYLRPGSGDVDVVETTYTRGDETLPALLYRPAGAPRPRPTWIVLHGLTWHGPGHPSLDRFVRAVAASGAAVMIPEIPEWRRLRVAPGVTGPSVRAAAKRVLDLEVADPDRIALLGFSFGATQALVAAATDAELARRLRAIAAWGGYYELKALFHFGFCGEYSHGGRSYRTRPDPYGAWIMGANYLTRVPGYADHEAVARALARLADESGRRGAFAGDPVYDPLKRALRAPIPASQLPVFDIFAPPAGQPPPHPELATWMSTALAEAAARTDPLLEPAPLLSGLSVPTLLAHGRDDRLVPFTESLRLAGAIPAALRRSLTVTSLFAHSGINARALGPLGLVRETARFVRLLRRLLRLPATA